MLSNHYPPIYNHSSNWLLLIILMVAGALLRHAMVTKKPIERWTLLPVAIGLAALVWMTAAPAHNNSNLNMEFSGSYSEVRSIMNTRCLTCHSTHPTDDIYKAPPLGLVLESEAQAIAAADKIRLHVVLAKTMPIGNKTQMTDSEREVFRLWLENLKK